METRTITVDATATTTMTTITTPMKVVAVAKNRPAMGTKVAKLTILILVPPAVAAKPTAAIPPAKEVVAVAKHAATWIARAMPSRR